MVVLGKLRKSSYCWGAIALGTLLASAALPAYADGPDRATVDYITQRYNLPLEGGRDGCTRYANPQAIYLDPQNPNARYLPVLLIRGELGGTLCTGVFKFVTLTADCKTNQVAYLERIGSSSNWEPPRPYENAVLAQKVCALSAQKAPR